MTAPDEREMLARHLFDHAWQNRDAMRAMTEGPQCYESWEAAKTFADHLLSLGWCRRGERVTVARKEST